MSEPTTVTIELNNEADAMALAQFVKRCGWQEWRQNAVSDDEAYRMKAGFWQLQKGLAEAGFAPR